MTQKKLVGRSLKDIVIAAAPSVLLSCLAVAVIYKYVDPAPPKRLVMSTGELEGDYHGFAKIYQELLKEDAVELVLRPSSGAVENLKRLNDPKSDVDVAMVQDGLGSDEEMPDLESLGSIYYEPVWVFYRGNTELHRFSQLAGKKIAIGGEGGGTKSLALTLLKESGVTGADAKLLSIGAKDAVEALKKGEVDAAFFVRTPENALIGQLIHEPSLRLMSIDQAEALTRRIPYLHHLTLPHGSLDVKRNLPERDIDLVAPTATLLVRDSLHPALTTLLLKAATHIHSEPGILERKGEFPIDKDYEFPLSTEARHFYKSGTPFWQRYLPFWLATLVDRFILFVIPAFALILPTIRLIPRFLQWRVKSRIYRRYGELKYLETQIKPGMDPEKYRDFLQQLDAIEDRVNHTKIPLEFSDHAYVLREHIEFVRQRARSSGYSTFNSSMSHE